MITKNIEAKTICVARWIDGMLFACPLETQSNYTKIEGCFSIIPESDLTLVKPMTKAEIAHDYPAAPEEFAQIAGAVDSLRHSLKNAGFKVGEKFTFKEYVDGEYTGRTVSRVVTGIVTHENLIEGRAVVTHEPVEVPVVNREILKIRFSAHYSEYRVEWKDQRYYTDDKEDALATGLIMSEGKHSNIMWLRATFMQNDKW